jgi:glycosyltransferase involved in cell wall biosynthesis
VAVGPQESRRAGGRAVLIPMKVIHAVGWYYPETLGGTEVYVAAVARHLRQAGHTVLVAAPRPGAAEEDTYDHEGTTVFRYPIPATPTRAEVRGEVAVRGAEAFHQWLSRERADVVHIHTFVTGLDRLEVQTARASGARVFVTTHSSALGYLCLRGTMLRFGRSVCDGVIRRRTCAACALQYRAVPKPLAWAAAMLPLPLAAAADRVEHPLGTALGLPAYIERRRTGQQELFDDIACFFVLTDWAREAVLANGAPAAQVALNRLGVDTDVVPIHPSGETRRALTPVTVGFLGRLDPIKGIDDLLRAMDSLPANVPLRLEIRGVPAQADAGGLVDHLTSVAARDPRVQVGPMVPRADVGAMLRAWDVLCCPGTALEGGPTVALEAFAVGTPVVGTRIGGLAELVEDGVTGRLVEPGDWRGLADVLRQVAWRPSLLDEWRQRLPSPRTMHDVADDYLRWYTA